MFSPGKHNIIMDLSERDQQVQVMLSMVRVHGSCTTGIHSMFVLLARVGSRDLCSHWVEGILAKPMHKYT